MYYPPLFSIANPTGPRWSDAQLSTEEAAAILRRLVMLVGFDDRDGRNVVLGSGFIVGTAPDLIVLTARRTARKKAAKRERTKGKRQ